MPAGKHKIVLWGSYPSRRPYGLLRTSGFFLRSGFYPVRPERNDILYREVEWVRTAREYNVRTHSTALVLRTRSAQGERGVARQNQQIRIPEQTYRRVVSAKYCCQHTLLVSSCCLVAQIK